jgi:hypothetical protein
MPRAKDSEILLTSNCVAWKLPCDPASVRRLRPPNRQRGGPVKGMRVRTHDRSPLAYFLTGGGKFLSNLATALSRFLCFFSGSLGGFKVLVADPRQINCLPDWS